MSRRSIENAKPISGKENFVDRKSLWYGIPAPEAKEDAEADDCKKGKELINTELGLGIPRRKPKSGWLARTVARGRTIGDRPEEPRQGDATVTRKANV